jgi:hypothetical protein
VSGDNDHDDEATHVPAEQHEIGPAPTAPPAELPEQQPRERDTVV